MTLIHGRRSELVRTARMEDTPPFAFVPRICPASRNRPRLGRERRGREAQGDDPGRVFAQDRPPPHTDANVECHPTALARPMEILQSVSITTIIILDRPSCDDDTPTAFGVRARTSERSGIRRRSAQGFDRIASTSTHPRPSTYEYWELGKRPA